jgi:hypothetical protein
MKEKLCKICLVILNRDNWYKYHGTIYNKCKKCRSEYIKKLNDKRSATLKKDKWF